MTQEDGTFTIPARLYLNEPERLKLMQHVREDGHDLNELVSGLVRTYLAQLPDAAPPPAAETRAQDIQLKQRELRRLKGRQQAEGIRAPRWLDAYISALEVEIRRLQAEEEQA